MRSWPTSLFSSDQRNVHLFKKLGPKWFARQCNWYALSHSEWFSRPCWWDLPSSELSRMIHLESFPAIHPGKWSWGRVNHAKTTTIPLNKAAIMRDFVKSRPKHTEDSLWGEWTSITCQILLSSYKKRRKISTSWACFLTSTFFQFFFSLEESPSTHPKHCSPGFKVNSVAHVVTGRWGEDIQVIQLRNNVNGSMLLGWLDPVFPKVPYCNSPLFFRPFGLSSNYFIMY